MSEKTIQEKIKEVFFNTIAETSKFTPKEIEDIKVTLTTTQRAEKIAERLLKIIGGSADENT